MLNYKKTLKTNSRTLRSQMTDAEQRLWHYLRHKQLCGIQFYRQKPIGGYIVDFYAAKGQLIIELDGSQHAEIITQQNDRLRDEFMESQGLRVLRFDNRQVLVETEEVVWKILEVLKGRINNDFKSP